MSDQDMQMETNDQLVLIAGLSAAGKSASLRNIRNQERWLYMNTEAGKKLPFRNKFQSARISDPWEVVQGFDWAIDDGPDGGANQVDGIIVDSLTFLMDMFESQYIIGSANTMKAWGDYNQFFKTLLQDRVIRFGKPVIFIAHVKDEYDEKNMETKTAVPVKGALKGNGVEAYFSCVVGAKKVSIKELEKYGSDLLKITDDDKELGYKHVFQTRITKGTTGERIRSPMDLFTKAQTYMDNDSQMLLDHLHKFYS